jgi:pimeloyl-ACP methyl ester carboxylesterase
MAQQNRYITLGGHRHRYVESGNSEHTLLLLHGISSSIEFYEQVIPLLSKSFRVIALDLLGFGLSDKPQGKKYSLELYASLIHDFLEKTESIGEKLSATGHSMGGKYLLASALLYPGTYNKLVLSSTDGFIHVPSYVSAISLPLVRNVMKSLLTRKSVSKKMFDLAFHNISNVNAESYRKILNVARDPGSFDTVMALNRNLTKLDLTRTGLRQRLGELNVPVLIIWGDHDRYFAPEIAQTVKNEIPAAKLVMFEECGHSPMLEYPEKFSRTITEFILSEPHSIQNQC